MKSFEAGFAIPQELYGKGKWPLDASLSKRYSLPSNQVDVGAMLGEFRGGLEARCEALKQRLNASALWGEHMSLHSIPEANSHFEYFTGAIQMTSVPPEYQKFYSAPGRTNDRQNGKREVRGARYFANIDDAVPTPREKNARMREDWRDAVDTLMKAPVPAEGDMDAFFARVGVLDYMKQHALTAFHALTYPERLGKKLEIDDYARLRAKAVAVSRDSVRSYYRMLLGREDVPPEEFRKRLDDFTEVTKALDAAAQRKYYKAAEIDHPAVILTNADAVSDSHPATDTIVALPSGGTQIGYAVELAMEIKQGKGPHVILLPLSTHSHIQTLKERATCEELEHMLVEEGAPGSRVLVVDDNSNSGNSIQTVVDLLEHVGAQNIAVDLAELDPQRVIYKQMQEEVPETVAHMMHEDFDGVSGVVPITRGSHIPLQVRKLYSQHVLRRHYENQQPVLGIDIEPHPFERSRSGRRPYLVTGSENKAKAGHRFGMRVFNGNTEAVDRAESEFDARYMNQEGVVRPEQAADYMFGVAMAKLDGISEFIIQEGESLAKTDAYAYARDAAIPPSIVVTDTNLVLGQTLLKKPTTQAAAGNILQAYAEAREAESEVKYITNIGRVDINKDGLDRSFYQVAVTVGKIRPDADLDAVSELLRTKPDRVGGIGSFEELMRFITPQPIVLEVTKWIENDENSFILVDTTMHTLEAEKTTAPMLSMLTRGFVPTH